MREWRGVEGRLKSVSHLVKTKMEKMQMNQLLRSQHKGSNLGYLETLSHSLQLLKKERTALEKLVESSSFTGDDAIERRLLETGASRLHFQEKGRSLNEELHETHYALTHPVEVDAEDLKNLLNSLEGEVSKKPQLLVTDFKLNRKIKEDGNESFELDFSLLMRSFISK
jgi:hypothetical protein